MSRDWSATTDQIYRLIRAAGRPYPGAFTRCGQRRLTVWRGRPADATQRAGPDQPGRVLAVEEAQGILVATGDGALWMTEMEPEAGGSATDLPAVGARLT